MNDEYYKLVTGIMGGYIALADLVNDVQEHVAEAISNQIIDLDGPAFVLSDDKTTFQLLPITNGLDLSNTTDKDWQDLKDLYVRRKLMLNKNGVKKVTLKIRNLSAENQYVTVKLYTDEYEDDYSVAPVKTATVTIEPTNEDGVVKDFIFNVNHLYNQYHYLVVQRTNVEGVSLRTGAMLA